MMSRTTGSSSMTRIRPSSSPSSVGSTSPSASTACLVTTVTTAGRRTVNVEPSPGALSTATSPPIISQNRRVIIRPRPVPPYFRVVEASAWVNGRKSRASCSTLMPIPESLTRITNESAAPSRAGSRAAEIVIVPSWVNLLALLIRFKRAWRNLVRSAWIDPSPSGTSITRALPFFSNSGRIVSATPRTASSASNVSR